MKDSLSKLWSHLPRNKPAFFFAAIFVVYGFLNISPHWWLKCLFGPFGLYVEYEAQWIWGYAMTLKRKKRPWAHWALFNIIYILLLALPTGAGLFITEIATQEAKVDMVDQININRQAYIESLQEQIRTKTQDLTTEFNKYGGNGDNYKSMQKSLDNLNDKLEAAINTPQTTTVESVVVIKKDMFTNVADLTRIPKQWIIGLMLTASLLMVYVGLWKKPMVVNLENFEEAITLTGPGESNLVENPGETECKTQETAAPLQRKLKIVKVVKRENIPLQHKDAKKEEPVYKYPPIIPPNSVLTKPLPIIQEKPKGENEILAETVKVKNDETLSDTETVKLLQELEITEDDIPDMIKFVEGLYDGTDDNNIGEIGVPLKGVQATSDKIKVPFRRCYDYKKFLNGIGAINTTNGIPSRGLWPKSRIIKFIEENVERE